MTLRSNYRAFAKAMSLFGMAAVCYTAVWLLLSCICPRAAEAASGGAPEQYKLPNGLKILIQEDHSFPVVASMVWYRVGSRNETPGSTGITHLVEHLLFGNVGTFRKGEIGALIARNGGQFNAFTSDDFTTFFELLPPSKLDLALRIESERMRGANFAQSDIQAEIARLQEEFEVAEKDFVDTLAREVRSAAYFQHPYHTPTTGWRTDVDNLTVQQARAYYTQYFRPDNATIVIVGDVKAQAVLSLIKKYFEPLPKPDTPVPAVDIVEQPQKGERRVMVKYSGKQEVMQVAYHAPALQDADAPAMFVLEKVLAATYSGRLKTRLVNGKLCSSAQAAFEAKKDPGLFTVTCVAGPGIGQDELLEGLDTAISQLRSQPVPDAELKRARNQAEFNYVSEGDGPYRSGFHLGFTDSLVEWQRAVVWPERLRGVTAADVQRVAKRYLNPDARVIGWLSTPYAPKPPAPKPPAGESTPPKEQPKAPHSRQAMGVRMTGYKQDDSSPGPNVQRRSPPKSSQIAKADQPSTRDSSKTAQPATKATKSSAKTSAQSSAKSSQTSAKVTQSSAKTGQSSAKAAQPAAKATESSAKTAQPSAKATESSAKTAQPSAKATESSARTAQPSAKATESSAKTAQPSAKAAQPPSKTAEPPTKVAQPPANTTQLPNSAAQPSTKAAQPPANTASPSAGGSSASTRAAAAQSSRFATSSPRTDSGSPTATQTTSQSAPQMLPSIPKLEKLVDGLSEPRYQAIHERVLKNGMTLIVFETHLSPIVQITGAIKAGDAYAPSGKRGLASVLVQCLNYGSTKHSRTQLNQLQEDLGLPPSAMLKFDADSESISFQTRCLARDLGTQLGNLSETLSGTALADADVEKAKQDAISEIKRTDNTLSGRVERAIFKNLIASSSPYVPSDSSELAKSIANIKPPDVKAFQQEYVVPGAATIVLAGDVSLAQATQFAEKAFAGWSGRSSHARPLVQPNGKRVMRTTIPTKEGSDGMVCLGQLLRTERHQQEFSQLLLADCVLISHPILARLGQAWAAEPTLQDKIDADGVQSFLQPLGDVSIWSLTVTSPPDVVHKAVQALITETKKFTRSGITQEELSEAKRFLAGTTVVRGMSNLSLAAKSILDATLQTGESDYIPRLLGGISDASVDSVNRVIRSYLKPDQATMVIAAGAQTIKTLRDQVLSPRPRPGTSGGVKR